MSATRTTLLVGTTKAAFLVAGDNHRSGWAVRGPYCDGWPINHIIGDPETGTLWAGGGGDWHGAGIWRSEDGGATWKVTRLTKRAEFATIHGSAAQHCVLRRARDTWEAGKDVDGRNKLVLGPAEGRTRASGPDGVSHCRLTVVPNREA